jgi:ADP-heptose:LPS heptosyltransferase
MKKFYIERGNKLYRFLDRYVGIPLASTMGLLCRRSQEFPSSIKRIGILKTACIGDTILLDAATKDLRKTWPKAQQVFLAGRDNYQIAEILEEIDKVIVLPMNRPWAAVKRIYQAGHFDLWLDFSQWARVDSLLTRAANAECKIGFMTPRQYRHYCYDIKIEHRQDVHELDNYRNLIRVAGVIPKAFPVLSENSRKGTFSDLSPHSLYGVLHMFPGGSRAHMKEWPQEYWLSLAQSLLAKGLALVFTGNSSDFFRAQTIVDDLGGKKPVHNLAGRIALSQLPALLAGSSLVVSVDTGVMHMAAAVGARLIAIHGPTSPLRWGPISLRSIIIAPENMNCSPCLHLGFEYKCNRNYCMESISPITVLEAVNFLLTN